MKPFNTGRFRLEQWGPDSLSWAVWLPIPGDSGGFDVRGPYTDADLRHINRITAKALAYRHRGKVAAKGGR